jgi:Lantibiotic biosynthesis dehydratase C-term
LERLPSELAPDAVAADGWRTAKIYYFDKNKDALLLDCLRPLVGELRDDGATACYLERHWQGGPHVRCHFKSVNVSATEMLIGQRVREFLQRHPSQRAIDPEEMRRRSALLAKFEALADEALQPDNSVRFVEFPFDQRLWPSADLLMLARDYMQESLPLLFRLLEASRGAPGERRRLGMLLVLLYASTLGDLKSSYRFARGYVEKYVALSPAARHSAIRAGFREAYKRGRRTVLELVASVDSRSHLGADQWIRETWQMQHNAYRTRVLDLLRAGVRLTFTREEVLKFYDDPGTVELMGDVQLSADHSARDPAESARQDPSQYWKQYITEQEFQAHVVLVNLLYRTLDVLGITVAEKIALLGLLAEGVEERHAIQGSWQSAEAAAGSA